MAESQVNFYKIKRQAHRLNRSHNSGGGRFNPFSHTYNSQPQSRAATFDAAERGEVPVDTDANHDNALSPFSTAPPRIPSREENRPTPDGDIPSQTTTDMDNHPADAVREKDADGLEAQRGNSADGGVRRRGAPQPGSPTDETATTAVERDDSKDKKPAGLFRRVEPNVKDRGLWTQLQRTVFNSWINILLLAAPAGIALEFSSIGGPLVFAINFIAIVPLAAMLGFATEEIALRTGEVLGGLINATFGNAVELIVAIIALVQGKVVVVQTSLVGSILSNLLLVLGCCFLCGGFNRREQFFNTTVAQTAASLLALAVSSLIVPTVFAHNNYIETANIAKLSHGVAVILLFVYAAYLFFQLKTHSSVFNEESQKVPAKQIFQKKGDLPENSISAGLASAGASAALQVKDSNGELNKLMTDNPRRMEEDDEEEEEPQLTTVAAFATMVIATVLIALCSEGMVSGIDALAEEGVSEEFTGLILLPIVGNACEHATAVTVAIKDKMDLAIGVAIGSSMQVALFLIPVLVIIGWGMGVDDMSLRFDDFQVVIMFVSVLLVNYLIGDGKSHWLEGTLLLCLYLIIAVCSWWYPADNNLSMPGIQS